MNTNETTPDRWEHGSHFHYMEGSGEAKYPWDQLPHSFWGSGRGALVGLLSWGRGERGWRRIWIPGFFCQDVVPALSTAGVEVVRYTDTPLRLAPDLGALPLHNGDVVLLVNYYGIRGPTPHQVPDGITLIEDHSHDPLVESNAEYCVSSLRKTLPVPDGAIVWSPRGYSVPKAPEITPEHSQSTLLLLSGMLLKARFLSGGAIEKDRYREAAVAGENGIGRGEVSGVSAVTEGLLSTFPITEWGDKRRKNYDTFARAVRSFPYVELLGNSTTGIPLGCALVLPHLAVREQIRQHLIARSIYPAVLWPCGPDDATPEEVELSERILLIHCDQRYDQGDMERVARELETCIAHLPSKPTTV